MDLKRPLNAIQNPGSGRIMLEYFVALYLEQAATLRLMTILIRKLLHRGMILGRTLLEGRGGLQTCPKLAKYDFC